MKINHLYFLSIIYIYRVDAHVLLKWNFLI